MTIYCPDCGTQLDSETQYCPTCGRALMHQAPPAPASYYAPPSSPTPPVRTISPEPPASPAPPVRTVPTYSYEAEGINRFARYALVFLLVSCILSALLYMSNYVPVMDITDYEDTDEDTEYSLALANKESAAESLDEVNEDLEEYSAYYDPDEISELEEIRNYLSGIVNWSTVFAVCFAAVAVLSICALVSQSGGGTNFVSLFKITAYLALALSVFCIIFGLFVIRSYENSYSEYNINYFILPHATVLMVLTVSALMPKLKDYID